MSPPFDLLPASDPPASVPLPVLSEGVAVLVRPDNRVHVGSDPQHSLVFEFGAPVVAARVADLLRTLTRPRSRRDVATELRALGLDAADLDLILHHLAANDRTSVVAPAHPSKRPSTDGKDEPPGPPELRVRVHGRGPLAAHVTAALAEGRIPVRRSVHRPASGRVVTDWDANLVVLTDFLVHEPWVIGGLMRGGIAHLQVRVRDGVGVVGPLVLPGLSSCLDCVDLHRADLEPVWPLLATQLVRKPGRSSTGIARATAALAFEQVEQLATALRSGDSSTAPHLVNRVLELHPAPPRIEVKTWTPHPLCTCR